MLVCPYTRCRIGSNPCPGRSLGTDGRGHRIYDNECPQEANVTPAKR